MRRLELFSNYQKCLYFSLLPIYKCQIPDPNGASLRAHGNFYLSNLPFFF